MKLKISLREDGESKVVAERIKNGRRQVLVKRSAIEDINFKSAVAMIVEHAPEVVEKGRAV